MFLNMHLHVYMHVKICLCLSYAKKLDSQKHDPKEVRRQARMKLRHVWCFITVDIMNVSVAVIRSSSVIHGEKAQDLFLLQARSLGR